MAVVISDFIPHKKQLDVIQDKHRFKVIACGRRFGKTKMAVNHLVYCALKRPGNYWYIAPTLTQAKMIAWEMLKSDSPEPAVVKKNENELWIKYITGGSIRVLGADNEEALRGAGLKGAILDEFADMKVHVWQTIIRPMLLEAKGWCWFLGTPKGYNHFYEMFIRDKDKHNPEYRDIEGRFVDTDPDYKSWQFRSIDSPYIDEEEVKKAEKESSPEYFRQEYLATFENFTGLIFKEFKDSHVQKFTVDRKWNIFLGIDTGKFTAVSFIGLDYNDKAWVFDEIYSIDEIVEDIVAKIKEKLKGYGLSITDVQFIIDSASQVKREYMAQGILTIDSEKDVLNSIDIIRARLKNDKIAFHEKCIVTVSQYKAYSWEKKLFGKTQLPKPKKENDHTVDCGAYVLNSKFVTHAREYKKQHTLKSFREEKLDVFSKDFEQMEDELNISWHGSNPFIKDKDKNNLIDSVTGY